MKRKSSSTTLLPSDDAPRLTKAFFDKGEHLIAGKKVTKAEWQVAARAHLDSLGKKRISIMLDAVVIDYFKTMAGEHMVNQVRHVLREELAAYKIK